MARRGPGGIVGWGVRLPPFGGVVRRGMSGLGMRRGGGVGSD